MYLLAIAILAAVGIGVANASPPPPPPEYVMVAADRVVPNQTAENFDAYASVFAPDLRVFVNEVEVALDREAWLGQERERIGEVVRRPIGYAPGWEDGGSLLVVDQYDDRAGVPDRGVADGRPIVRAARYTFALDGLVHELRFTQAPGSWSVPSGLRAGEIPEP